MQKTKRRKRVALTVRTIHGKKNIRAYPIGQGLYVHRLLKKDQTFSKHFHWTVTVANGFALTSIFHEKLQKVITACKYLTHLDWTNVHRLHHKRDRRELYKYLKARNKFKLLFEMTEP